MAWEGLRFSIGVNEVKRQVQEYCGYRAKAFSSNTSAMNAILEEWALFANNFVPLSNEDVPHHLQQYYVSDGRVTWYSLNRDGEDITEYLYEGGKGTYKSRYDGHEPQAYWDQAMVPGTVSYDNFIKNITPIVLKYF